MPQFSLRLTELQKQQLEAMAKKAGLSQNAFLLELLEDEQARPWNPDADTCMPVLSGGPPLTIEKETGDD